LLGEKAATINSNHLIIRTNIFGFNMPLRNSLAEWAIENLENGNEITGFDDIRFNAVYTKHLAKYVRILSSLNVTGLYNVASKNSVTKYDFVSLIAKELGVAEKLVIRGSSKEINFKINRPLNTTLNTKKVEHYIALPTIEEGISEMILDYKSLKKQIYENN